MNWILNMMDRIFCVVGAVLFSQVPTFMQQYAQQLGGRSEELKLQIDLMAKTALYSGKNLKEYIQKFLSNTDSDISQQGELMQEMTVRYQKLSEAASALNHASVFEKPYVFFTHLYSDVASSTLQLFTPGFSFSLEGIVYAFIGILFGTLIFSCARALFGSRIQTA